MRIGGHDLGLVRVAEHHLEQALPDTRGHVVPIHEDVGRPLPPGIGHERLHPERPEPLFAGERDTDVRDTDRERFCGQVTCGGEPLAGGIDVLHRNPRRREDGGAHAGHAVVGIHERDLREEAPPFGHDHHADRVVEVLRPLRRPGAHHEESIPEPLAEDRDRPRRDPDRAARRIGKRDPLAGRLDGPGDRLYLALRDQVEVVGGAPVGDEGLRSKRIVEDPGEVPAADVAHRPGVDVRDREEHVLPTIAGEEERSLLDADLLADIAEERLHAL